ncbi:hypothetical protein [Methanobrevibacter arboriphilus]|uniref:Uncharacterized protein n=1 Tax=Methanobrevibacter arboriphilus TaxID=39441 RepID=A0ACA8R1U0_METAZ|nr:hypothetical protein [Methanobrevibacter arboriphilus]BBL61535.1 hypothetical protein MarbSA_05750 [Methanobrevibacter arboriphilus]
MKPSEHDYHCCDCGNHDNEEEWCNLKDESKLNTEIGCLDVLFL